MKKIAFILLLAPLSAYADYTSTIEVADCQEIASSGSITGSTVGTVAGGTAGALIGRAMFGRKGGWIGGIAGSIGGGMVGEKVAGSTTYKCVVKFKDPAGKTGVYELIGKQRRVGEVVKVYAADNNVVVQ